MFLGNVFNQNQMNFFTGIQFYVHRSSGHKYRVIKWEWNEVERFKFYNEKGRRLTRIPGEAMEDINVELMAIIKNDAPWMLKQLRKEISDDN